MTHDTLEILKKISVLNRDDGKKFTCCDRLDAIAELLWNSSYRRINPQGLFHLYSKVPASRLPSRIVVFSSHVDCEQHITRCFTEMIGENEAKGTFDNALTNASILSLMLEDELPEHVVVAFTGDEEEESKGAKGVSRFFEKAGIEPVVVVLDVTDMGWDEKCAFTVENDFWNECVERVVLNTAQSMNKPWRFVPEDPDHLPRGLGKEWIIDVEAEPDESWEYDDMDRCCFSLCIPVSGEMHSNEGVLVRTESVRDYTECLKRVLCRL